MASIMRTACMATILLALAWPSFAQGRGIQPRGGVYDPTTEVTVSGTVESVSTAAAPRRAGGGLHLMVRTEAGPIEIDVGPAAFVTAQGFAFATTDSVTVVGAKVTREGRDAIIARRVEKEGKVLTLRDERGIPAWSRGRGRPS